MQTNQEIKIKHIFKHFWKAIKPQKWSFFSMLTFFVFSNILHILIPLYYKKFFDLLGQNEYKNILSIQLVDIIIMVLIMHGFIWALNQFGFFTMNRFVANTMSRIRQMCFDYTIRHSYSFFANNFTGSLVQRVGRFARSFERLHDTLFFNLIPLVINIVGVVIVIYTQNPTISYILIGWTAVMIVFNYFFQRWKLKYDTVVAKADSLTTANLADSITNQNTIASFAGFKKESDNFKQITNNQSKLQKTTWDFGIMKDGTQVAFIFIAEFLLFYYAIKFWEKDLITIGTFVLIQTYIIGLAQRLWDFGKIIKHIYESFADSKEMVEILETPYEIKDKTGAKPLNVDKGEIRFENASFAFNQTRTVLDNININIKGGEKIALIGPSGAGKSTMIKLLTRMYDLTSGAIKIDEQNIEEVLQDSLRSNISLVPQDPILFHRTLMENIRYGKEDATDEEVIEASRLAHCDEFIDVLPLKYETFVGERGIKLSGGERQRVAIARAILKNAPILILDEATSSLDSHSESLIQDALDRLMKDKTTIVIAHRLSTIRKMDRVIVIDQGKILEEGSHKDLINKEGGLYKKLWDLQAGGFI